MQNTGTWNSDYVLMFMGAFLLPIFISIVGNVFRSNRPLHHNEDVLPNVVGSDIFVEDSKEEIAAMRTELKLIKEQLSKLQTKKSKSKENKKNNTMMQEAAKALNTLGIKKSKANSIV